MPNELVKQISYILYKADEEDVKVNALLKDESIWLTQNIMAELFDVNVPAVSKHLKNIYECGELEEASTISILERVRSIRASERKIWQQITDIFAECSIDYDKNSEITKQFYATVQNKFHFAITGQTAAEIVYDKADHKKEHMGLTR